ncbi:LbtU family siderophore porin [Candidatus Coxiella mudrowiae]|uniref:LbtU family siderophore porin n=1 Tax=Candidatus Coxiella mudrowiae TaxID=2054173 RepID=UPI0012FF07BA|nr:LbtU family siderophore porin [Candidatus Coxiella mudrowiae]
MSSKFLVSIVSLCVASALTSSLAATNQQINKRIDHLQEQINQLRAQQKKSQNKPTHTHHYQEYTCPNGKCVYHTSRLGIGPYLNTQESFDGSELIINTPTVREDSRILLNQYQLEQECREMGIPTPPLPRVIFSGKLEGQIAYGSTYAGSRTANIKFSGAELDTYIQGNLWVSGYMALDYDPDELVDGSRVFMNRAFVTIGNLSRFPFYTSIGQVYVAFGRYNSLMISSPVTLGLGRTRARALTVGYQTGKNALHAEVYGYQELTNNLSHSNQNNQWGTDIGYEFNNGGRVSGEVGASLISNLADSQGMQATVFLHDETLHHTVQAIDFYGSLAIDPVVFIAEYVGALRSFDVADVSFGNQGAARPTAFHAEANYTFHTGSKPSSLGIGYGHTTQALALGLPQNRYSIFYNVSIWRDTNFALEYRHDINYSRNAISTGINPTPSGIAADLGKSDNVVTAQFDLYF